jgi:glycerol-3-phosphate dehydrogenase (NAD(P)+)
MYEAVAERTLVIYAPPSHVLRAVAGQGSAHVAADATIAVASKGIERDTLGLMTDVVADALPGRTVVALSGPSFAAEVAARQPTAVVAASGGVGAAALVQRALSSAEFRVYSHDDVIGVELGGALKNVMAVATGILEGLGLGFNARAALMTRGLAEMTRWGSRSALARRRSPGLAGLGDLVLTCTGSLSRNRSVGVEIGQGRSLAEGQDFTSDGSNDIKSR